MLRAARAEITCRSASCRFSMPERCSTSSIVTYLHEPRHYNAGVWVWDAAQLFARVLLGRLAGLDALGEQAAAGFILEFLQDAQLVDGAL